MATEEAQEPLRISALEVRPEEEEGLLLLVCALPPVSPRALASSEEVSEEEEPPPSWRLPWRPEAAPRPAPFAKVWKDS